MRKTKSRKGYIAPWAKSLNETGYFLTDTCASASVKYFDLTRRQLDDFLWLLVFCSSARPF